MPYADYTWYSETYGGTLPEEVATPLLAAASDATDALTYNRIVARGFDNLTQFQQDRVRRAVCAQANFLAENQDAVESAVRHYSINGVSIEFGNEALYRVFDGTPFANNAYGLLRQTGLTSQLMTYSEVEPCGGPSWL